MARGGQRRRHGYCVVLRNASFMRTVFCEYTLYLFCAFFCDFLLFLLLLSPFLGILMPVHRSLLGGSERRSLEADCTPQKNFWLAFVRLYGSLSQAAAAPRPFLSAGLENVLRMSPTRSLLHLLGRGAGPVIRRVWTLTCDRETRRPRPRRGGAKLTGAWASAPLTVHSLRLAAGKVLWQV